MSSFVGVPPINEVNFNSFIEALDLEAFSCKYTKKIFKKLSSLSMVPKIPSEGYGHKYVDVITTLQFCVLSKTIFKSLQLQIRTWF